MSQIRQLAAEADFDAFARIGANAYPGTRVVSEEDRQRLKQRLFARADDPLVAFYGLFEGEQLRGAMRLHDFTINVRGARIPAGGVGFVAVDLLHKKEGVAKELVQFFLHRCRERGQHLALLYPFRPDFYRKMGFGYGAKMSQYRVRPADLPGGGARQHVEMLGAADKQLVGECYARLAAARHGLIDKSPLELDSLFAPPENRVVGYRSGGALAGYMVFSFAPAGQDTFLVNDILVKELVYESPAALAGILAFLRSQADQIRQVIFNLQDDAFHHLLADPRDGSEHFIANLYQQTNRQGLGIMYRVVDTRALLADLSAVSFGDQDCRLRISVRDSFLPANHGDLLVRFAGGRPAPHDGGEPEVAIQLDVADLSALLMGVVGFRSLHRYGVATISAEAEVGRVDRLFRADEPPVCMTWF